MAGAIRKLTGCKGTLLAAGLPRYAPHGHEASERAMAHSTGLRFFLFEVDGPLLRLPKQTVDGMIQGEVR